MNFHELLSQPTSQGNWEFSYSRSYPGIPSWIPLGVILNTNITEQQNKKSERKAKTRLRAGSWEQFLTFHVLREVWGWDQSKGCTSLCPSQWHCRACAELHSEQRRMLIISLSALGDGAAGNCSGIKDRRSLEPVWAMERQKRKLCLMSHSCSYSWASLRIFSQPFPSNTNIQKYKYNTGRSLRSLPTQTLPRSILKILPKCVHHHQDVPQMSP